MRLSKCLGFFDKSKPALMLLKKETSIFFAFSKINNEIKETQNLNEREHSVKHISMNYIKAARYSMYGWHVHTH